MTDTRYVYLMETETEGRYKIGFSVDPVSRAKQITADSNQQESIKDVIVTFATERYKQVESTLHQRYADYRVWSNREYFDFDEETLQMVKFEFMSRQLAHDLLMVEDDPLARIIVLEKENTQLKNKLAELQKQKDSLYADIEIAKNEAMNQLNELIDHYNKRDMKLSNHIRDMTYRIQEITKLAIAVESLTAMTSPPVTQIKILINDLIDRLYNIEGNNP